MYSFSFTRFLSQKIFPRKVLTRHILLSMDVTQGGVLWINGRLLIWNSYSFDWYDWYSYDSLLFM